MKEKPDRSRGRSEPSRRKPRRKSLGVLGCRRPTYAWEGSSMSERLNLYGFSLPRMRRLFRSQDLGAVTRMRDRMATEHPHLPQDRLLAASETVEKAIMTGVPFAGLDTETDLHWLAANALAGDEQDWLVTPASVYHASALRD